MARICTSRRWGRVRVPKWNDAIPPERYCGGRDRAGRVPAVARRGRTFDPRPFAGLERRRLPSRAVALFAVGRRTGRHRARPGIDVRECAARRSPPQPQRRRAAAQRSARDRGNDPGHGLADGSAGLQQLLQRALVRVHGLDAGAVVRNRLDDPDPSSTICREPKCVVIDSVHHGVAYDLELRLRGADGSYRWFIVRGRPLRTLDGSVASWFGTCTDIDAQKTAAEALADRQ